MDVLGNFCIPKISSAFFASRICVFSSINHQCNFIKKRGDLNCPFPPGLRSHLFQVEKPLQAASPLNIASRGFYLKNAATLVVTPRIHSNGCTQKSYV